MLFCPTVSATHCKFLEIRAFKAVSNLVHVRTKKMLPHGGESLRESGANLTHT